MKTVTLIELEDGEIGFEIPPEIIEKFRITETTKVFMSISHEDTLIIRFEN